MQPALPIPPDPLPALRRFAYVWLGLLVGFSLLRFFILAPNTTWLGQMLSMGHAALLATYLSLPPLQARLGRAYLPIALIFAAFGSQLVLLATIRSDLPVFTAASPSLSNVIAIAHWLLLWPTVAVVLGWKYRFRTVVLFAGALGGFSLLSAGVLFHPVANLWSDGLVAFGFLIAAMITIGYFVGLLSSAEQAQRAALLSANLQLVEAAATVEQLTISRERNALARELHDTLAHTLSGLAVQLETARAYWQHDPQIAHTQVEKALAATRSGLHETRRALQSLRARPLEDLGLILAIEQLARSAAARADLQVTLDLPREPRPLDPRLEQGLYRIAQEAIANVVRHAAARNLAISLHLGPPLRLRVYDDGRGFSPSAQPALGHYGLLGMHERAALIGATFTITSQPNGGTDVLVVLASPQG